MPIKPEHQKNILKKEKKPRRKSTKQASFFLGTVRSTYPEAEKVGIKDREEEPRS